MTVEAPNLTASRRWRDRRPTAGSVAWIVQRFGALILLVLVPLKVVSGWAFRSDIPGRAFLLEVHTNGLIDVLLIGAVAFHAAFGIRAMLIDMGWVHAARRLTVPMALVALSFTVLGAVMAP